MATFNTTKSRPPVYNHEGHIAHPRSDKLSLFLLAAGSFAEQDSFYTNSNDNAQRLKHLSRKVAVQDPEWMKGFIPYLRRELGMRTASVVIAAEAADAMAKAGVPGGREIVKAGLARADEPGEMIAYWRARHGRMIPKPIKRGIADAVRVLYNERNYLKWDSSQREYSFKDVLRIVRAKQSADWQSSLFDYITKGGEIRPDLRTLQANAEVRRMAKIDGSAITQEMIARAGLTWEDMPSLTGRPWDAENWEKILPSMRFMATLRNLNNFSKASLGKQGVIAVRSKLESEEDLRLSKTGPLNILAAIKNQVSSTFTSSLGTALENSVMNIPHLPGRTLILIDTSGSMGAGFSKRGETQYWEAAMLFGLALARRCDKANVVSFSTTFREFPQVIGEDLLTAVKRFNSGYNFRGGTAVDRAIKGTFRDHDRVVILTDEQYNGGGWYREDPLKPIPASVPIHTYNLAGYRTGGMSEHAPNRFYMSGLNDRAFTLIPLMEQIGKGTRFPWEV